MLIFAFIQLEHAFDDIKSLNVRPPLTVWENQLKRMLKKRSVMNELKTKEYFDNIVNECTELLKYYPNSLYTLEALVLLQVNFKFLFINNSG